nr:olfactory receptor 55 [Gregopimpla kuwanae]
MNKILMSSIGQWPYQTRRTSRAVLSIVLFLCTTQIGPQLMAVSLYHNEPEILVECLAPLLFDGLCAAKLFTCIVKSQKMLKLLNRIRDDWQVWANDPEVDILHEYAENARKFTIVYAVIIYSTGIMFLTEPILPTIIDILLKNGSEPRIYPFPVHYGQIDMQKYYVYIILYTYVCVSMIMLITIAGDVMFIGTVLHACGIFAAVGSKLRKIGENEKSAGDVYSVKGRDRDYETIAFCIDRHNEAIEYAKLLEETYSSCLFFVVGFNMFMMSITGVQLVTRDNNPQDVIRFVNFVAAQMIHLFIEMYISQLLMDGSGNIRYHIQSCQWYKISLKARKLLHLMTMRCNAPSKLTAGKICVMSVETYGVVVKTSMSYFTLLQSMQ